MRNRGFTSMQQALDTPELRAYWANIRKDSRVLEVEPEKTVFRCEMCADMGQVKFDVPVRDPRFGKMFPCPNPHCPIMQEQRDRRYATLCRLSQIPEAYLDVSFDLWANTSDDSMAGKWDALGAALAFVHARDINFKFSMAEAAAHVGLDVQDYANDTFRRNSIVYAGINGVGKTSLAISIARYLLDKGIQVVYARFASVLDAMKERFDADKSTNEDGYGETAAQVARTFAEAPVLILDEFGLAQTSAWAKKEAEQLVNARYTAQRPTIFTTNLDFERLGDTWGLTTAHRVHAMAHWITVSGIELRYRGGNRISR